MFVKVCTILALVCVATATDLESGYQIMACAKHAISGGVPELNIPTHDPYVVIKHNFSWQGDFLGFVGAQINVTNLTWTGLATWNLTANQTSKDSDAAAAFNFKLYWKWMSINATYRLEEKEGFLHQVQTGPISIGFEHSTWIGSIVLTKPTKSSNGTVDATNIKWHVKDIDVSIHGLGLLDNPTELALGTAVKTGLNSDSLGNVIGDFIKMRLETIWWNTGKVWDLVEWCKNNPETKIL